MILKNGNHLSMSVATATAAAVVGVDVGVDDPTHQGLKNERELVGGMATLMASEDDDERIYNINTNNKETHQNNNNTTNVINGQTRFPKPWLKGNFLSMLTEWQALCNRNDEDDEQSSKHCFVF